jgi:FkbM family methyltransferase
MLPRVSLVKGDNVDYLLFSTHDAISSSIFFNGSWASPLLSISRLFYVDIPNPFIMDIGANLGAYAIPIGKDIQPHGGLIYAYEPQRIIYYQLCGNIFLNRLDNVHSFCQALSDKEGLLQLPSIDYEKSTNIGGFSLDETMRDATQAVEIITDKLEPEIPMITLDNINVPSSPCLIKLDVEWLEYKVLSGGKKFLEKHGFPPLLLEASAEEGFKDGKNKILELLKELGYEVFSIMNEIIAQHPNYHRFIKFTHAADGSIQMERQR